MARTRKTLGEQHDIAHCISAGVLARTCPRALIEEVLRETGRGSQRERLLPAPAVVYYVMALALWREAPLEEVLRVVSEGLHWLGGAAAGTAAPLLAGKSGISQARTRLSDAVMQRLAERVLRPLARADTRGAWYRGRRLVGIDGTCLDVADEAANATAFGYPGVARGAAAYPQLRLLGLVECGTHAVIGARIGAYAVSELVLAKPLLAKLSAEMLCLADRQFFGFELWRQAAATGAQLLWRAKTGLRLPVERELPDGSYLTTVYGSPQERRQRRGDGLVVRVIDYALPRVAQAEPAYRLLTNWLDERAAPAEQLVALYHERWELEGVFAELKTHLRGASTVLRSKTPQLVRQELWGLLLAHFAVRQLMHEAAYQVAEDPDRLSFVHAVRVLKRKLPQAAALPP